MSDYYYIRALQALCCCLNFEERAKAKKLLNNTVANVLEEEVNRHRNNEDFLFNAGRAYEHTLDEASEEGTEALSVCIDGLIKFKRFILCKD